MHTHNTHAHTHTNTLAACACFGQFDSLQADKVEAARRRVKSALLAAACYLARTEDRKLPSQADALLAQQAMAMYRQCANSAAAETAVARGMVPISSQPPYSRSGPARKLYHAMPPSCTSTLATSPPATSELSAAARAAGSMTELKRKASSILTDTPAQPTGPDSDFDDDVIAQADQFLDDLRRRGDTGFPVSGFLWNCDLHGSRPLPLVLLAPVYDLCTALAQVPHSL